MMLLVVSTLLIKYGCKTQTEKVSLIIGELFGILLGMETPWYNRNPWKNSFRQSPFSDRNLHYLYPFVYMHIKVLNALAAFSMVYYLFLIPWHKMNWDIMNVAMTILFVGIFLVVTHLYVATFMFLLYNFVHNPTSSDDDEDYLMALFMNFSDTLEDFARLQQQEDVELRVIDVDESNEHALVLVTMEISPQMANVYTSNDERGGLDITTSQGTSELSRILSGGQEQNTNSSVIDDSVGGASSNYGSIMNPETGTSAIPIAEAVPIAASLTSTSNATIDLYQNDEFDVESNNTTTATTTNNNNDSYHNENNDGVVGSDI